MKKRMSFKTKVLIPIIWIFIISVMIISYATYSNLRAGVASKTAITLDIFTGNIIDQLTHLDKVLSVTKQTLNEKHIAIARTVLRMIESRRREFTSDELLELTWPLDIIELSLADRNGILVNSSIPSFIGFDYKEHEPTKKYMGLVDGTISEIGEEPRVSLLPDGKVGGINHYVGIPRSNGRGFLQAGFSANMVMKLHEEINIQRTIKQTQIGNNGYGMVLTNGIITAHPNEEFLDKDVTHEPWYQIVNKGEGLQWVEIDGEKYLARYRNVNDYSVIALVPEQDYYREIYQMLVMTFIFLFLAVIVIIVVVNLVLSKLLSPIGNFVRGLDKIAKGDLDTQIDGNYNDEFDLMKVSINNMTAKLKAHINDKFETEREKVEAERVAQQAELEKEKVEAIAEAIREQSIEFERKMHWYVSILDSIALPITVTDPETKWTFVNRAVEEMLNVRREDIYGLTCDHWNADICNTENCGIECILRGITQTQFTQNGCDYLVNVAILKDIDGLEIGFIEVVQDITEILSLRKIAEQQTRMITESITYASKIQRNLLPLSSVFAEAFADSAVIWEPRDIVGGDIYWMKSFVKGTVLCVADCTGHGVPGALLTMLVVSAMQVIATHYTCEDTAGMLHKLDQRLATALNAQRDTIESMSINDGCDLAVVFVAPDGSVSFSASGISVFVCDGQEVVRHKGQTYHVGEGKVLEKDDIKMVTIPADTPLLPPLTEGGKKFYIASDGLFDQMNTEKKKFGFKKFQQIVLENHTQSLANITTLVREALSAHQGDETRCDDVSLVCFKPKVDDGEDKG